MHKEHSGRFQNLITQVLTTLYLAQNKSVCVMGEQKTKEPTGVEHLNSPRLYFPKGFHPFEEHKAWVVQAVVLNQRQFCYPRARSEDIFGCPNWEMNCQHLVQRPGIQLNTVQCTRQSSRQTVIQPKMSTVQTETVNPARERSGHKLSPGHKLHTSHSEFCFRNVCET